MSETSSLLVASDDDALNNSAGANRASTSLPDTPATDAEVETAVAPVRPRRRAAGRASGPAAGRASGPAAERASAPAAERTSEPTTSASAEPAAEQASEPAPTQRAAAPRTTKAAKSSSSPVLTGLVLSELQSIAAQLGISGTGRLRKSQLIEAIETRQGGSVSSARAPREAVVEAPREAAVEVLREAARPQVETPQVEDRPARESRSRDASVAPTEGSVTESADDTEGSESRNSRRREGRDRDSRRERQPRGDRADRPERTDRAERADRPERTDRAERADRPERADRAERTDRPERTRPDRDSNNRDSNTRDSNARDTSARDNTPGDSGPGDEDEFDSRGRRRRGRFRDRNQRRTRTGRDGYEAEPEINDDDVLVPVAGVLDILESYAFVRTSGYLPGPNDVYVSLAQVRKNGLRKGDAITGAVKAVREGEKREKFNAMVRLDTVNGVSPDEAKGRVEFGKLTPLYPQDRLRLETEPARLTTRIIDLVSPIGKGQRGLIVSPPKAGKTMVLQAIANAITTNNPETHLMVVLVDERPEEVTDMQRSVKGEVIASTFDRPAEDHTIVAELAIERAKRLVELGHDVVILLDSITRLGRAYNLAAPASGRILSGGVDSTALYPPKRFFGAARNIENGGSLTILATALVETGSRMDEVIFEEFKGTGNMELKLDRKLADKRIFPAVDVDASGTRKEEILMGTDELSVVWKLRRVMSALDQQQAIELMIGKLKQTSSNSEFLLQVQKTMPIPAGSPAEGVN